MDTFSQDNQKRIRLLAQEVRSKHDAMDWSVSPAELIKLQGLTATEYDLERPGFIKKVKNTISNVMKKIKAAIFIKEKLVFIDTDLHHAKKPFAQAHELGHDTIEEHKAILYVCSEHDLVTSVRDAMEFEANIFASEILLPTPLMKSIHDNYPFSMQTILYLNSVSFASIHACAIRYVKTNPEICCLLVLKQSEDDDGNQGLWLGTDQILSPAWWSKYRRKLIGDNQFLSKDHNLSQIVFSGLPDNVLHTEVTVIGKRFHAQVFYNKFNVFALLYE